MDYGRIAISAEALLTGNANIFQNLNHPKILVKTSDSKKWGLHLVSL